MTLNERVLAAVERHVKTKWARVFILALDESVLLAYLRAAFHETGAILRDYDDVESP